MRNEVAKLITEYADGTEIKTASLDVMCDIKSVTRAEFYAAYAAGLNPRFIVDISPLDYASLKKGGTYPNKITIDGETYLITRAYAVNTIHMELTVS